MALGWVSSVDGLEFDSDPGTNTTAALSRAVGVADNRPYIKALGQPVSIVAGTVANQPVGTAAIPAIVINVIGTVVVSNTLVTANSFIIPFCKRVGADASTARGPVVWVDAMSAGSVTFGIKAQGVAIAVSTYVIQFLIIN